MSYWSWGVAGFAVGTAVAIRNARRSGIGFSFPVGVVLVTVGLYAGILGTKLLDVALVRPELFREDLPAALAFWNGGLAWQGFVLAFAGLAVVLALAGKPVWLTVGCAAPGLALAHAISRLGCLSHGCCHGAPSDLPWAIWSTRLSASVHPTQLYSLVLELGVFGVLQWAFDRRPASRSLLFPAYLMLFSFHRFGIGFLRGDAPGPEWVPGLRADQVICVVYFAAGALALFALQRRRIAGAAVALLALLAPSACGVDRDVLAEFQGGEITRAEFHEWLDAAGSRRALDLPTRFGTRSVLLPTETVLRNELEQERSLVLMILDELAAREATDRGLDREEPLKTILEVHAEDTLVRHVRERAPEQSEGGYSEAVVSLRYIFREVKTFRWVTGPGGEAIQQRLPEREIERRYATALEEARAIVERLRGGEDFAELALEASEFPLREPGGDVGYQLASALPAPLADAVFSLEEGGFTPAPITVETDPGAAVGFGAICDDCAAVSHPPGVYVAMVTERRRVSPEVVADLPVEPVVARQLRRQLLENAMLSAFQSRLGAETAADFEKVSSPDEADVIFRIDGAEFRVAELNARVEALQASVEERFHGPISSARRRRLAEDKYRYELCRRLAERAGLLEDPAYQMRQQVKRTTVLAREYRHAVATNRVQGEGPVADESDTEGERRLEEWAERALEASDYRIFESRLEGA